MKRLLAAVLLSVPALLIAGCSTSAPETACSHVEVTDAGSPATCTETGLSEGSHCSVCGAVIREQTVIPAAGHSFEEWKDIRPVSCTENGEQERTCTSCGLVEKQETAAPGHDFPEEWTIDVPATCLQTGRKSKTCTRCGEKTDITEIPMTDHVIVTDPAVPATCKKSGLTEGSHCGVCNAVITAQKKTTGSHNYSGYKCTACGKLQDGHQVDYLKNWITANGSVSGETTRYRSYIDSSTTWSLIATEDEVGVGLSAYGEVNIYITLYFDHPKNGKYDCIVTFEDPSSYADVTTEFQIAPKTFTKNTPITLTYYNGPQSDRNSFAEASRITVCELLSSSASEMKKLSLGMTIADLGFTSFK